jgi:DNA-binding transcriptional LysR family regulator
MDLVDRVASRLKLRDLRLLDTVVRQGSMAKAANQLNLSQPAISKAIAEMEHVLGVRLIDRGRQGVEPTPYGATLLRRGLAIYDELRQGVAEIEQLSDPTTGTVRVAAPEPIGAGLLTALITQFTQKYPRAVVHVTQTPVASLQFLEPRYRDLRSRNVDFVVAPIFEPTLEDDLTNEPLLEDRPVIATGVSNPWARRRNVSLGDIVDEPWVLQPEDTIAGRSHIEAFTAAGLAVPGNKITSASVHVQIGLAAAQKFFTIFPHSMMHFSATRLSLKSMPINVKVAPFSVGIVRLKKRSLSPAAQEFIRMARDITRPLRGPRSI